MVFLQSIMKVFYAIGFNPYQRTANFSWYSLRKWFLLVFVFYSLIPQLTFTMVNFHDILKFSKSLGSLMRTVNCLGKICVIMLYRKEFKNFFEEIEHFIHYRRCDSENAFQNVENRTQKMFCVYNWFCWTTTVAYGLTPALSQTYKFVAGQATDDTFVMPFDTEFFFDSSKTGVYQICYLMAFVSLLCTVQGIVCVDSLFLGSCFYIGEMYATLDTNLKELNTFYEDGVCPEEQAAEFKEILHRLLKDHNEILTIIGHLNEIYRPIVLDQFLTSQIMISGLLFQTFNVSSEEYLLFFSYLSVALYQLFIYCYGGAVLSHASQKFASNVYDLNWYQYPIWAQKYILLILCIAQKTQTIGGTFFQSCDFGTFSQILKFSYLMFTVLNSLK